MGRDITGTRRDITSRLAVISRDRAVISRGTKPGRNVQQRHRAGVVNLGARGDANPGVNTAAGWLR